MNNRHPRTREYAISMPGGGPPPHADRSACFWSEERWQLCYLECAVEEDEAHMAAFGFSTPIQKKFSTKIFQQEGGL